MSDRDLREGSQRVLGSTLCTTPFMYRGETLIFNEHVECPSEVPRGVLDYRSIFSTDVAYP